MNIVSLQQRVMHRRSNQAFELFVVAVIIGSALRVGIKTYDLHPQFNRV